MIVPHRTPFFLPYLFPQTLLWRKEADQRKLYLTFDDGPVNGPTDFVLETLNSRKALATFFCIGDNVRKHRTVFENVLAHGHAVGNHTYNHLNGWKTNVDSYVDNVARCEEEFQRSTKGDIAGKRLFRPPYGRITRRQLHALGSYQIVMWDVLTIDYNKNLSSEECLKNSIKATRPGSIIVFHDSFKAEKNLTYVLPRFIDTFLEQDYSFETL